MNLNQCSVTICTVRTRKLWKRRRHYSNTLDTGCPNKHGNSVPNSISSLLWISIVIPNFKSHNITMSNRVYFMKTVNGCKDVFIMSLQDEQWRRTSLLCLYTVILLFYQPYAVKTNKQIVNIADEILSNYSFFSRYHYTKSKDYLKRRNRIRHWIFMFIGTPCTCLGTQLCLQKLRFPHWI